MNHRGVKRCVLGPLAYLGLVSASVLVIGSSLAFELVSVLAVGLQLSNNMISDD